MYGIEKAYIAEIIVKNSKFISILRPFNDDDDINEVINEYKNKYKGASHYTYSYKTMKKHYSNDDGEPSMTAGIPILEELNKNDLQNVLCIVVRYFGGVKLGFGGLRRAYKEAAKEAILKSEIKKIIPSIITDISFEYKNTSAVKKLIKNCLIINETYIDNIHMTLKIPLDFNFDELIPLTKKLEKKEKAFILK